MAQAGSRKMRRGFGATGDHERAHIHRFFATPELHARGEPQVSRRAVENRG